MNFLANYFLVLLIFVIKTVLPVQVNVIRPYIIGGDDSGLGDVPYQALVSTVRIENGKQNRYLCGGSLLNAKWVLTAGHCVTQADRVDVVLGITNRLNFDSSAVRQKAKKWIVHRNYGPISSSTPIAYDIALVLLEKSVKENDVIKYIDLASDPNEKFTGKPGLISGWGKKYDRGVGSTYLQHAEVRIIDNGKCLKFYPHLKANTLCVVPYSNFKVEAPCNGDSGGPLVVEDKKGKMVLVGIVSYGKRSACERGFPSVFTRVASFTNSWIIPTMNSHEDSGEDNFSEERPEDTHIDLKEDYAIGHSIPTDISTFTYMDVAPRYNVIQPKQIVAVYPRNLVTIKYTYPVSFPSFGNLFKFRYK